MTVVVSTTRHNQRAGGGRRWAKRDGWPPRGWYWRDAVNGSTSGEHGETGGVELEAAGSSAGGKQGEAVSGKAEGG